MNYRTCKYCGCYLPDNTVVCLACHKPNSMHETTFEFDNGRARNIQLINQYQNQLERNIIELWRNNYKR